MRLQRLTPILTLLSPRSRAVLPIRQIRSYHQTSHITRIPLRGVTIAKRFYSANSPAKIYSFEDIKTFSSNPTPNRILIDTREPGELQTTGTIPGSINIPVTSQPDAFFITADEFEERLGFERPGVERELVFYCKAGVRSHAASTLARSAGWNNVAEYPGSWLDWDKNGGAKQGGS